jgi:hypothetical protein
MPCPRLSPVLLLCLGTLLRLSAAELPLVIDLGATPAADGTVTLPLLPAGEWALVAADGTHFPIARCGDGLGRALLPGLAGVQRFTLAAGVAASPLIAVEAGAADALRVTLAGRELATWQGGRGVLPAGYDEKFRRGGYLARLLTPAGRLVTDDLPDKHRHHHGVWWAWTKTVFAGRHPDFWNMGNGTGGVQNESTGAAWSAGAWAGWSARNRYDDLTATPAVAALGEQVTVTLRAPLPGDPVLIVDLVVAQHCLGDEPLLLPTYHYGGLGLRGNGGWDGAANTRFLTSEGRTRADGNGSRGRWCWMGGLVEGATAGIAVLGHPSNIRAPQPLRLHPSEPFLCFAPSQLGDWRIAPQEPLVSRYRLIVADGEPSAAELERRWQAYANPPGVTLDPKPIK